MGLKQNLENIQTNLTNAKTAIAQSISNKGVECNANDALSTYASKIDSISGGGSGKFVVPNGMKFGYSLTFDGTQFDVSNVTDMSSMFNECRVLTNLDLSNWNTSNVINMSSMFSYCSGLTSLSLSNFDTSNVINMNLMFNYCSKLTSLNLSNFDTSNVTNMGNMFSYCTKLTSLSLSNFDTSNVTNMGGMFSYCSVLTNLDLSSFNTSNVTNMSSMFNTCKALTNLDLSSFNTSNVTNMSSMFSNCKSLTDLKFNDIGHKDSTLTLDLTICSALTKESVLFLFNNAFDRATAGYTQAFTIKLNATTKALLSEEEIAIATNKGFTVV